MTVTVIHVFNDLQVCICVYAGIKLKLSEEAVATAQVFYHTFVSVMDQDEYEATVSAPGISPVMSTILFPLSA